MNRTTTNFKFFTSFRIFELGKSLPFTGDGEVDVIMRVVANPGLLGIEFQFTLQLLAVFRLKQQGLQSGIEDHPLDAPLMLVGRFV